MSVAYKPIKFFLNICGNRVRNLDELRAGENFHLDELYQLFTFGILEQWLSVHGYNTEHKALSKLPKEPLDEDSAKKFCSIMRPDDDKVSLELIIQNFKLTKKWKKDLELMSIKEQALDNIINQYHFGFQEIKQSINANATDMPAVKEKLDHLSKRYIKLFHLNQSSCIEFLKAGAPVALLLMLANPILRDELEVSNLLIDIKRFVKDNLPYENTRLQEDRILFKYVFPILKNETDNNEEKIKIDSNIVSIIRSTNMNTTNSWSYIEPNTNKFMILHADDSTFVCPYQNPSGALSKEEIDQFPIINGIGYRSSNNEHYLIYMEI